MDITRRTLITSSLGAGLVIALPGTAIADEQNAEASLPTDPFTLGVASGDPRPDGFVLWTRLALDPLAEDGLGGMPSRAVAVEWEVADDERYAERGPAGRRAGPAGEGLLRPRRSCAACSRAASTSTGSGPAAISARSAAPSPAPAWYETPAALTMAFASCAQYEHGYFTAYRRLAEDQPDLVLHLGDYQYEYKRGSYVTGGGNVRDHEGPETVTLANYRQRHAQYKCRPRPSGRARRRAVAGGLGRPRGGEQLGRRGPGSRSGQPRPRHFRMPRGPPRSRRTTRTCRCAAPSMPARHRTCSSTGGSVGPAGELPHAGHPPVPGRPGRAGTAASDCAGRLADRRAPITGAGAGGSGCSTASGRSTGALGHPGPAGVLRGARPQPGRRRDGGQHGRLGRLRRLPAADHPGLGGREVRNAGRAHR